MDKPDLIQKLKRLAGITDEERSFLIDSISSEKKYGLVWEDKTENEEQQLLESLPLLTEVKEKAVIKDKQSPNHTIIEGDNLHALTTLSYTHQSLIDVIYIDPPYNTGNKDFKYNDRYVDKDDSYRHSKWLSFMHRRLKLAKELLSDNGVIFISIDDNEQAQLRLLCDEVFGEENCYGEFTWLTRTGSMDSIANFSKDHEYIFAYGKRLRRLNGIERTFARYTNPDSDPRGPWIADNLSASKPGGNTLFAVKDPKTGNEYWPPKGRYWPYNPETMQRKIEEGRILFPKNASGSPLIKRFRNEAKFNTLPVSSWIVSENTPDTKKKNNTLYAAYNTAGTKELQEILGDKKFSHPKPTVLITQLIEQASNTNSTILDFFAGSGSTLHATMLVNKKDGGNRKCILVTNNENKICEDVTYERNRRVIEGYKNTKEQVVEGLTDNNLRYYKTELIDRNLSDTNKKHLSNSLIDLLCFKENCYLNDTKRLLSTRPTWLCIFTNEQKELLIIVQDDAKVNEAIVVLKKLLSTLDKGLLVKVYVLGDRTKIKTKEFNAIAEQVILCPLPDIINDLCSKVSSSAKKSFSQA